METEVILFRKYLRRIGFTESSVKTYEYQFESFITVYPDAKRFGYKDIMLVLEEMSKQKPNVYYRISILATMKKYYDYLIDTGQREDHPCKKIMIKHSSNRGVLHQDLFSSSELELLMEREDRYPVLKMKNQAVISMLIYQGLTSSEIANMKVKHINLDEGKIFVKESSEIARRHLEMHPKQYRIFDRYINEFRDTLLKTETDKLIIGMRGNSITTGEVGYLVEQFKVLFPGRTLNPKMIRRSVISNWLNEKKFSLETVQLMAGHRWISTTARFKSKPMDEKRALINRFHPLG